MGMMSPLSVYISLFLNPSSLSLSNVSDNQQFKHLLKFSVKLSFILEVFAKNIYKYGKRKKKKRMCSKWGIVATSLVRGRHGMVEKDEYALFFPSHKPYLSRVRLMSFLENPTLKGGCTCLWGRACCHIP